MRRRCGNIHKAYTCLYIHFFKRLTEHLLSTGLCSMSKGHSNSSHRASLLIEREAPKIVRLLQIMINAIKNCNSVMRYSLSRGSASRLREVEWSEKVFLVLKVGTECFKGASHESVWGKGIPGSGYSKCRGPEAVSSLASSRSRHVRWSGKVKDIGFIQRAWGC